VDLIADDGDAVGSSESGDLLQVVPAVGVPERVVRVAQHERSRAGREGGAERWQVQAQPVP
jgi:hypothetical protein